MSREREQAGARAFALTLADGGGDVLPAPRNVPEASHLARLRAAMRASPWATLAVRSFVMMLGLVVLAWIGRAATAAPSAHAAREAPAPANVAADAGTITSPPSDRPPPALPSLPATAPPPAPAIPASPAAASHGRATPEDPVFINHASAEELRRLPGVGPKRADAIVSLRQRMGKFQRVEDLLRVKGVGRATLRKWRPLVRLDVPAAPDAATPPSTADTIRAP